MIPELENRSENNKKMKIFYIAILVICILLILVAILIQIFKEKETQEPEENPGSISLEELEKYKDTFDDLFENKVTYLKNNSYKIDKIEADEEIVYMGYQEKSAKLNDYDLDVNIPYINIDNNVTNEYNRQIKEIFEEKAKNILNTQNGNIIYTVNYRAYVTNNILSIVIRSTLKEGTNPQRDIVQTYNYDLTNQKEYTIQEMLDLKGITKQEANRTIKAEIKNVQEKVEELAKLGYNVYPRDASSDMYNINNVTEYFIGENNALYIIYAYGNENYTSEMDIIVM